MYEFPQSDLSENKCELQREGVEEYIAMGYTPGTASQLAHLNEHLLRDIGLGKN